MTNKNKTKHLKLKVEYTGSVLGHHVSLKNNFQKITVPRKEIDASDILVQRKSINIVLSHRKKIKHFIKGIHKQLIFSLKKKLLPISKVINQYSWKTHVNIIYCPTNKEFWFHIYINALKHNCAFRILLDKKDGFSSLSANSYSDDGYGLSAFLHDITSQKNILQMDIMDFENRHSTSKYAVIKNLKMKTALLCEAFFKTTDELYKKYKYRLDYLDHFMISIAFNNDFFFYAEKFGLNTNKCNEIYTNLEKKECLIVMIDNNCFGNIFDNIDIDELTFEQMAEHISLLNY